MVEDNGTGSLVFTDSITAVKSSRMNSELFGALLSAKWNIGMEEELCLFPQ